MAQKSQGDKRTAGGLPHLTYNEILKLRAAREKEYTLQSLFKYGYRNKEDISNLPANTLVVGSQNVLTNAAEQIVIRNGYQLDGSAGNQNSYGIDSSFDFNTQVNGVQNLRKWGTNLEVRYVNPSTKVISWVGILATLIATNVVNFCSFWTGVKSVCLFVNGSQTVWQWTGAIASFLSATSNSITVSGTKSLSSLNFDGSGTLLIDGVQYGYTSSGLISTVAFTQTPTNAKVNLDLGHYISQQFTTGAAASTITSVTLNIAFAVSAGTFYGNPIVNAYLCTNNAGTPGTFITGTSATTSTNTNGDYTLTFAFNVGVSPATAYHMVFNTPFPNGSYPLPQPTFTIGAYIGASGSVGTNVATTANFAPFPTSWSSSNGYLNMTVNENDISGTTFAGVTPDPTSAGINVGDAVVQVPTIGASGPTAINGAPLATFDLIANLSNQIYYGSFTNPTIYISKTGNFTDTTFSTPRKPSEGANSVLDAPPVALIPQAEQMYASSGRSGWWRTVITQMTDATNGVTQTLVFNPLQTASNQGTQSQGLIGKLKNSLVFVSNETIVNAFGPVKNILGNPNFVNMSDPIKYDIDAYNFTGGQVYFYNYFLYITLPMMGIERLYNVNKKYWEAPQVVPFSRHYEVSGVLYAHSGLTNESYQCYVPGVFNDNGNPINSVVAFPYVSQEGGAATELKNFNKQYTEGYISSNTDLMLTVNYDFGGFTGTYTTIIVGSNRQILFNKITDGSLGQNPLGTEPIGSILNLPNLPAIPKFRVINTFPRVNCFEYQIVYSSDDVDQDWALLRLGPAIGPSTDLPTFVTI